MHIFKSEKIDLDIQMLEIHVCLISFNFNYDYFELIFQHFNFFIYIFVTDNIKFQAR